MMKAVLFLVAAAVALVNSARVVEVANNGFPRSIASSNLEDAIMVPDDSDLVPQREGVTATGTRKVRYQQRHNGIPVYGSVITAEHDKQGDLTGKWRGQLVVDIEAESVNPTLQPIEALMVLRRGFGHNLFRPSTISITNEQAILQIFLGSDDVARLAYLASYTIEATDEATEEMVGIPARPFGFVDAKTGELLEKWDGLSHDAPAIIQAISGNIGSYGKRQHSNFQTTRLTDGVTCRYNTSRVQVLNMKQKKIAAFTPSTFTCSAATGDTYDYINGGYSALNDAAYYAEACFDTFSAYTGHNGPLNKAPLKARVHYGSGYENAYWDGTYMTIGDGASYFYPLVCMDVICHEYGHGFTEFNSNLQYQYMSGGMNEAFSDMAGEAAEYFSTGSNDFLIGPHIMKNGQSLRYMCQPSLDGKSIESANGYTSTLDVHYSSGVYNKAFCCLAQKPGWNTGKAFKIFARANDLYWSATSTFNAGACGVQTATTDLGYNVADVIACFASVQVACV